MSASDVIARLRELRAKATAGRLLALPDNPKSDIFWHVSDGDDWVCQMFNRHEFDNAKANAAAIVAAMNSLPKLLECAEALEKIAHLTRYAPKISGEREIHDMANAALDALSKDTP